MHPRRLVFTGGLCVAALLSLGWSAGAQEIQHPSDPGGQALTTGGALAPAGGAVDKSQGGVGGTGLGKMPAGSQDGKGMSVTGPPGQGIQPMQKSQ